MDNTEHPVFFGDWLKRRRKSLDLTQEELAQRASCSVFALRKIEAGDRRPSKQLAESIARALGVLPEDHHTFIRVARGELNLERLQPPSLAPAAGYAPEPTTPSPRIHLPVPPTPFIGRHPELDSLGQLLQDPHCRLLTLVGPGGIGKTRLAIQVASQHPDLFPDGVCFVPLASLTSSAFLVPTIVKTLGFSLQGEIEPRVQLLNYLRAKQVLLVLDNLEHLLESAGLIADILECGQKVKLLVTSRERLNLRGEWVFEIQGLPLPPLDQVDQAEQYSAVAFFVQSARRSQTSFELGAEERSAVIRICQIVEGMPLGIELAAAWVSVLTCSEIAQELERNLDFLKTSMRDVSERHRSLRAVFDHSWKLLSEDERRAVRQLSVFRGGFTRESAEAVAGASLNMLDALARRSVVQRIAEHRYGLHAMMRQYGAEKLSIKGEVDAVCARHLKFFSSFAEARDPSFHGVQNPYWAERLDGELDNFRAALTWAVEHDIERALQLGCALSMFWMGRRPREGHDWLLKSIRVAECSSRPISPAIRARVLYCLASLDPSFALARNWVQESLALARGLADRHTEAGALAVLADIELLERDYTAASMLYEESLNLYKDIDDRYGNVYVLLGYGSCLRFQCDYERSSQVCEAALEIARGIGQPELMGLAMNQLAILETRQANYERAGELIDQSVQLLRASLNKNYLVSALTSLGSLLAIRGNFASATTIFEEASDICQEIDYPRPFDYNMRGEVAYLRGDIQQAQQFYESAMALEPRIPYDRGMSLLGLGAVARQQGDYSLATQYTQEGLEFFQATQDHWMCGLALHYLGLIALAQNEMERARNFFRDSINEVYPLKGRFMVAHCLEGLAAVSALEGDGAQAARLFAQAHVLRQMIGAPLPPVDRPDYERYVAAARAQLGEATFNEIWAEGCEIPYEQAIADAVDQPG